MSDSDTRLRKVRTTFRPDEELEVGPAEYLDLKRQGLLVEDEADTEPAPEPEKKTNGRKATDKQEG